MLDTCVSVIIRWSFLFGCLLSEGVEDTKHLQKFNQVTNQLDAVRNESFYDVFPELAGLKQYA